MTFTVEHDEFHLIGFPEAPAREDFGALEDPPAQIIRESDETTILVRAEAAVEILARHPGARVERDLAWIRFETPMAWELVGFLALVTGELGRAGVPIGAVCGYRRDHLFVARRFLPAARKALESLFRTGDSRTPLG
ncbi:MAG: hypothetical protein ACKVXR_00510 [Planctomycetota bacterium]